MLLWSGWKALDRIMFRYVTAIASFMLINLIRWHVFVYFWFAKLRINLTFDSQLAQIASQIAMRIHINTPLYPRCWFICNEHIHQSGKFMSTRLDLICNETYSIVCSNRTSELGRCLSKSGHLIEYSLAFLHAKTKKRNLSNYVRIVLRG